MKLPTKEEYHKMGVPVGVGTPEGEEQRQPTEEELQEQIDTQQDDDFAQAMALNDGGGSGGYMQQLAPGDKAKIVQFMYSNLPRQETSTGKITGEVPKKMFYGLWGWLAHNSSFGNFDERDVEVKRIELDIQAMELMFAMNREDYDPQMNADLTNALHMADIKITQNKDGNAAYLATAEVSEDLRAYRVLKGKETGKMQALGNKLRGR